MTRRPSPASFRAAVAALALLCAAPLRAGDGLREAVWRAIDAKDEDAAKALADLKSRKDATSAAVEEAVRAGRPSYPADAPKGKVAKAECTTVLYPGAPGRMGQPQTIKLELTAEVPVSCEHVNYDSSYFLYVPTTYDPAKPHSLYIVFMGGNWDKTVDWARFVTMSYISPWIDLAERQGVIVAAPATTRGWGNVGRSLTRSTVNDVCRRYNVNPDRISCWGQSMGGHACWREGLQTPGDWAGIAPVCGGYAAYADSILHYWNVALYQVWGESDPHGAKLNEINRVLGKAILDAKLPKGVVVPRQGGHDLFVDEIPKIIDHFERHPRDLYAQKVFADVGSLQANEVDGGQRWTPDYTWRRPISFARWYWTEALAKGDPQKICRWTAEILPGNKLQIRTLNVAEMRIGLHARMVDLDKPVTLVVNGKETRIERPEPSVEGMIGEIRRAQDPGRIYPVQILVKPEGDDASFGAAPPAPAGSALASFPPPPGVGIVPPWNLPAFYDAEETKAIETALGALNLERKDLGFLKKPVIDEVWVDDYPWVLPIVDRMMDHPLEVPAATKALAGDLMLKHTQTNLMGIPALAANLLSVPKADLAGQDFRAAKALPLAEALKAAFGKDALDPGVAAQAQALPAPLAEAISFLIGPTLRAQDGCREALQGLDAPGLLQAAMRDGSEDALLAAWTKADRTKLLHAAWTACDGAERAIHHLSGARFAASADGPRHPQVEGGLLASFETPRGLILVGGPGPNTYRTGAWILIDVGGDDLYAAPAGASGEGTPVSVAIDLAGNDTYLAPQAPGGKEPLPSQGSGILGVGILYDAAGNDRYAGGNLSQGSGFFGAGLLLDAGGNDRYEGAVYCQGSGYFGLGALLDTSGTDRYDAHLQSQAFAGIQGIGLLSDLEGNDVYQAGGKHTHYPLLPDRYQSLSQGFSIGQRFKAGGGVALLADKAGSDTYLGDVYAQGTSYWLSLGMLYDEAGNDTYRSTLYSQGAGVHLSVGSLMDLAGEDAYVALHGLTQGSGHDYAVGVLYDRAGSDRYLSGGFAQGASDENSVALLLDRAGADQYVASREDSQGSGAWHRGTLSVGMLLDLGAEKNQMTCRTVPGPDRPAWLRGPGALLLGQAPVPPPPPGAASLKPPPPAEEKVDDVPEEDIEKLFTMAARWEVGPQRPVALGARRKLVAKGDAALQALIPAKLNAERIYDMRALKTICAGIGEPAGKALVAQLDSPDRFRRRAAVEILASMRYEPAAAPLIERLKDETAIQIKAIGALGVFKVASAVEPIAERLRNGKDEILRITCAVALGNLGDATAADPLAETFGREIASVRFAAEYSLSRLGDAGVGKARGLLSDANPQVRLHAIGTLRWALWADKEGKGDWTAVRGDLGKLLSDPAWTVRLHAARAMGASLDESSRKRLMELQRTETDPYVLSALADALR